MTDHIVLNFHGKNNTPLYHLIAMFAYKELALLPNVWLKLQVCYNSMMKSSKIKLVEGLSNGLKHPTLAKFITFHIIV